MRCFSRPWGVFSALCSRRQVKRVTLPEIFSSFSWLCFLKGTADGGGQLQRNFESRSFSCSIKKGYMIY